MITQEVYGGRQSAGNHKFFERRVNVNTINDSDDNMTEMREEVTTLCQALVSTQQQLALIAHQGPPQQPPTMPAAWQV